ncbi:MAG: cytochrome C oxidase subunit IV family protein [Gammaproteobacteria bacterium]
MIGSNAAGPRNAWLLLLLISAISFGAAELLAARHAAVLTIMAVAAAKIAIILLRFMEVDRAPTGIRRYMIGWNVACATLISVLWWMSAA